MAAVGDHLALLSEDAEKPCVGGLSAILVEAHLYDVVGGGDVGGEGQLGRVGVDSIQRSAQLEGGGLHASEERVPGGPIFSCGKLGSKVRLWNDKKSGNKITIKIKQLNISNRLFLLTLAEEVPEDFEGDTEFL